jgi:NAD-dependent SIR2 family protein deacetylase
MTKPRKPKPPPRTTEECPKCKQQKHEEDFAHFLDSNERPVCDKCGSPTRQLKMF